MTFAEYFMVWHANHGYARADFDSEAVKSSYIEFMTKNKFSPSDDLTSKMMALATLSLMVFHSFDNAVMALSASSPADRAEMERLFQIMVSAYEKEKAKTSQ